MTTTVTVETIISPLVQRRIFSSPVEAARTLVQEYARRQLERCEEDIAHFEKRYGMNWAQFTQYTAERTAMLRGAALSAEQRQALSQAIMQEEDDWLEWKATLEIKRSWLGLLAEEMIAAQ